MKEKAAKQTSRRGRPTLTEAEREAVRERIAEAAKELFRRDGYATVSIRKIAKAVGYTPMALYRYYSGKLEILQTLWGEVFEAAFAEVDAVERPRDPTDHLIAISSAYLGYWLDHPDHYRLVFMAEGVTQPDVDLFLGAPDLLPRFGVFAEALGRASRTELTPAEQKTKLDLLICLLHGIAHNRITISGYAWTPPRELVRVGVRGLVATPSPDDS